jgi:phosphomevalonate kinase
MSNDAVTTNARCAQAPGKLMLAGEYAVLGPAGEALAVAVAPCLKARAEPGEQWSLVRTDRGIAWEDGEAVPSELVFAHAALQTVRDACADAMVPHRISTHAPAVTTDSTKRGLGSSASAAVAVTAALCAATSATLDKRRVLDLALKAHRFAQGGLGSGYDVATITMGGLVHWRPARVAGESVGGHEAETIDWPRGLHMIAGYTGQSASTPNFLERLQAIASEDATELTHELMALGRPVSGLIQAFRLGALDEVLAGIEACHHALVAWDLARSLGVMTPAIEAMVCGAQLVGASAKVSGAGGGDSVVAFAKDPAVLEALAAAWTAEGFAPMTINVHHPGVSIVSETS